MTTPSTDRPVGLDAFHPAVRGYFTERFRIPTAVQQAAFEALPSGRCGLFAAPTGSGKTLAAFLAAISALAEQAEAGTLSDATYVVYVSPLRALSHDVRENLLEPLDAISGRIRARNPDAPPLRVGVRTGDTKAHERRQMLDRPPHLLVTTPESLYVLLTSVRGAASLAHARVVIVDEIHALVGSRRGDHLALSLERLDALVGRPLQRIGLSATQRPLERVARYLTHGASCDVVDVTGPRTLDLALVSPRSPQEDVVSLEVWDEIHDLVADLVRSHRSTLVFVGNRRGCERTGLALASRLGEDGVRTHHGSLARPVRLAAEAALREGRLRALVATSSLELGIDVGDVDLVVQLGSPGSIASLLQRVGRARHQVGGVPKGRLVPLGLDDLVSCVGLLDAVARGELEEVPERQGALDVLAQQLTAIVAAGPVHVDAMYDLVRRAQPYAELPRPTFDRVVAMLADGFETQRGRRGALVHLDVTDGVLRPRRGTRLVATTNGGTIPDLFDYEVVLEPTGLRVGTVHEDFAIESMAGDVFQLGSTSYRIVRVEGASVRVVDAPGELPTLPFWVAEGRVASEAATAARARVLDRVAASAPSLDAATSALAAIPGVPIDAAREAAAHLLVAHGALGALPGTDTLVLERFPDEAGAHHLVVHGSVGARVHRAFALALRKRMCRAFDVEIQAAAVDDAFLVSLGPQHGFALDEVMGFLRPESVYDVAVQAVLDRPVFTTRFRWAATRALAVPRMRGGARVPAPIQRTRTDDLLAVAFPDVVACLENVTGPRQVPDHPLVDDALRDCTTEWMDVPGLVRLLERVRDGAVRVVTRELPSPSPLARAVVTARPYAFLDDAPLEERRARAVSMRRFVPPTSASALASLDPAAIARARADACPSPRDVDELLDLASTFALLPLDDVEPNTQRLADALVAEGRAHVARVGRHRYLLAREWLAPVRAALPHAHVDAMSPRGGAADEEAAVAIARSRMLGLGPITAEALAASVDVPTLTARSWLAALEASGMVVRGRFTLDATADEFCERGLLARIHLGTLERLRAAVAPVEADAYFAALFAMHGVTSETRRRGREGLLAALEPLLGYEAPVGAWESSILPARVEGYDPSDLDALGHDGILGYVLTPHGGPFANRPCRFVRLDRAEPVLPAPAGKPLGSRATHVLEVLERRGPCFGRALPALSGLLAGEVDEALAELAGAGRLRSDGFAFVRALATPPRVRHASNLRLASVGGRFTAVPMGEPSSLEATVETTLDMLLARYGVVYRRLLDREPGLPTFRQLLPSLRLREARGALRGGRFLAGVSGEQYATEQAVAALRGARGHTARAGVVVLSSADPLNLVGLATHAARVPTHPPARLVFVEGVHVATERRGTLRTEPGQDISAAALAELAKRGATTRRIGARPLRRPRF